MVKRRLSGSFATSGEELAYSILLTVSKFDIGLAGHTHIATLHREFIKHNEKRDAILIGTYKIRDEYGRDLGFAAPVGLGSGAFVMLPDGRRFWCDDIPTAKDLLEYWKGVWNGQKKSAVRRR
jgi:hypothetical protein